MKWRAETVPEGIDGILRYARSRLGLPFDLLGRVLPGRAFYDKVTMIRNVMSTGPPGGREHAIRVANASVGEVVAALLEDKISVPHGSSGHQEFDPRT